MMPAEHPTTPDVPCAWPAVSVVIPLRNEEAHLRDAVGRVLSQEYPGQVEVVLAVAPSDDRTESIAAQLSSSDTRVSMVANPEGRTPAGLNAAIAASTHPIVVRVDGHGLLAPGYIRKAVELLLTTGAENVGGVMAAEGQTGFEKAVARATTSPLGIGNASFHVGGDAGPAETVYLGVFRREALERLGGFDETFHRAQDWELNYRIRQAGGLVWFSPELRVTYRPRSSWRALGRQYYTTGQWRRRVIRRYPESASFRYLAAPVATAGVGLGTFAGFLAAAGGPFWLAAGWLVPAGYALGVVVAGVVEGRGLGWRSRILLPLVLATMHLAWGAGFLRSSLPDVGPRRASS